MAIANPTAAPVRPCGKCAAPCVYATRYFAAIFRVRSRRFLCEKESQKIRAQPANQFRRRPGVRLLVTLQWCFESRFLQRRFHYRPNMHPLSTLFVDERKGYGALVNPHLEIRRIQLRKKLLTVTSSIDLPKKEGKENSRTYETLRTENAAVYRLCGR
jgi:hypothetical protein